MLVHLSNISPYVCDLNRGPIEQSNRMASATTKKATALLEQRDSFPKATRTPLKLLAPDEVPMDTTATATDINASLQPVWYTEQTIVDDQHVQQEDIASIIQEQQQKRGRSLRPRSTLPRSTLPPIASESPSIHEEELLPRQPSLLHKSSTFTIEPSIITDSPLNESEKENATDPIIPPSDESFRALEQLLGLGSGTTVRESPKTNHDTLSLTVVTPTDIINSTTTSLRMSYAPKTGSDSLPSSQDIPTMPTIESITSNPPSFLMENTTMEEGPMSTTTNQQITFDITDNDTIKDDTNNDDETNFSFELNDFPNNSESEPAAIVPPPPPMMTMRAPTCADVAFRALIKRRTGGRVSQPIKADSPLANTNKARSSAPTSRMLRSSCRRISTDSQPQAEQPTTNTECFVNTTTDPLSEPFEIINLPEDDEHQQEHTDSVTLNLNSSKLTEQNVSIQSEQFSTPNKPMMPMLSREYTYNTPTQRSSERRRSKLNSTRATPAQQTINHEESNSTSMLGILLTKPTETQPIVLQKTLTVPSPVRKSRRNSPSIASRSMLEVLLTKPIEVEPTVSPSPVRTSTRKSRSIASKSMLEVLLTKPTETQPTVSPTTARKSVRNSPSIASRSMLEVLLTKPTETEPTVTPTSVRTSTRNSPSIASKSMLGILLTNPTEEGALPTPTASPVVQTSTRTTRKSERASSTATPKVSINPLHSSTPSTTRQKSLQIVSIGEQEQVSTIVPQQINNEIETVQLNDTEEVIHQSPSIRTIETGVQTTPSLDISSRRRINTLEPQATPIAIINDEKQITPIQTKIVMNLQRKVCFQLTPTTDARLVAKEKLEENLRGLKPDIVINPIPIQPPTKPETVKSVPIKKATKPKKKIVASKKKKAVPKRKQPAAKKSRQAQKEKPIPPTEEPTKRATRKQRIPKVATPAKRVERKEQTTKKVTPTKHVERKEPTTKEVAPTKRVPRKQPIPEVTVPIKRTSRKQPVPEVTVPIKRTSRKRSIPEAITKSIEPIAKRGKISKSVELPPLPPKPQNESDKNQKTIPKPIKRETRTRSRSARNTKTIPEPTNTTPITKTSKRRLQSIEKNEGIKKKTEEIKISPVQNLELSQEERQKIEVLTVAGLKSRLNTHKADLPKGAKKVDLIALLIKIETNLLKVQKPVETTPVNTTTTTMTTRRRKK